MKTKSDTICNWVYNGLILTSKEEGNEIYDRCINSTHCEKCGKEYKNTRDRHMDHSHDIHDKYGYFRNVLCRSCNIKRGKIHSTNTSGFSGIYKHFGKSYKQGYCWDFQVSIDDKQKHIKSSINKEWLIEFAKEWKESNHYDD